MTAGFLPSAVAEQHWSAAALQQATAVPQDTAVVESPLPGGIAEVVRYLLNVVPSWLQITGAVVGFVVGVTVLVLVIRHRVALATWVVQRDRAAKAGLIAVGAVLLAAAAGFGAVTWNYTQHSNEFCVGCHVMNPAFHRFSNDENKHGKLSCHDCHQQSMYASARQVYLWVAERPEKIGEHAKVPNAVCVRCHVTADTATWQRIAATAGHRVHFESDSSALEDLQCVTCHGVEVHRFKPVAETCGQSGCHQTEKTGIVLGKMAGQTVRHCTSCHGFTADVPELATRDSARGTLVPGHTECLGCHEMQAVLTDFDARRDPHGGKCGTCHNPHTQETPSAAANSCATAGCHSSWREEPFHVGASHRAVGAQCLLCHVPHSARVDASDCQACHERVRARGARRPPVRFDTTEALRRGRGASPLPLSPLPAHGAELTAPSPQPRGGGPLARDAGDDAPLVTDSDGTPEHGRSGVSFGAQTARAATDTFPHARHEKLACLECHETGTGHGRLTFERPRGCLICHHQAPQEAKCETCHRPAAYGAVKSKTVTITVPGHAPSPRPVEFLHSRHSDRACTECHTTPVTLALAGDKTRCVDCHAEHHAVARECSACHQLASPRIAHTSARIAHERCDACHTPTTVQRLTPTRAFCATCHVPQRSAHYEPRECSTCHFLAEPGEYRAKLTGGTPRR